MRGKKAKALRRVARANVPATFPERNLLEVNVHLKRYPWLVVQGPTNLDGTPNLIDTGIRRVAQLINDPKSFRGFYRQLKKTGYQHA